jgi:hypothetical protein
VDTLNVIARVIGIEVEVEGFETVCLFCGTGLLAWLLIFLTCGIDLGPGFLQTGGPLH